jgi:hypothetical protein
VTLGIVIGTIVILASPVSAGGWWSQIDTGSGVLLTGSDPTFKTQVMFASVEEANRAHQGRSAYYAYLIEDLDHRILEEAMSHPYRPDWWKLGDATATFAGHVSFTSQSSNLDWATIALDVPHIEPGKYQLMLCTVGCVRAMADVIPSVVRVTDDPVEARLAAKVDQLRDARDRVMQRYRRARSEARASARREQRSEEQLGDEIARQGELTDSVDRLSALLTDRSEGASFPGWAWLALGLAVGCGGMLIVRRRRGQLALTEDDLDFMNRHVSETSGEGRPPS